MPIPRRKKFVRSEDRDPLKLTARDTAILRDAAEYRFLNSEQLLALHEGGRRNLKQRLSLLYQHGYLDRPEVQKDADLATAHIVYSLGRKGVEVVAKDAQEREGVFRRVREARRTTALISHALMISQFHVCLSLALKNRSDVKLTRWVQGYDLKVLLKRRGENPELVPDAFFVLETPARKYPCFLEADRATMGKAKFVSKLKKYWRHNREERFKQSLGVSHFRVLTIVPNEGHEKNLCRAAKDADDKHEGSLLYLFLSETQYSIAKPDGILEAAWKSPRDDTRRPIIE